MEKVTKDYEVVLVFSMENGEDGAKALNERFQKLIADNATVGEVEEWGRRRLAYPINDELEGYYVLTNFTSEPDFPKELNRVFEITDNCLRILVIRKDEVA